MAKPIFTPRHEQLRRLLTQARKASGLTQVQLSSKLSRSQSFVSKYEKGERRLDMIEVLEVTEVLGIDPIELLRQIMPMPADE